MLSNAAAYPVPNSEKVGKHKQYYKGTIIYHAKILDCETPGYIKEQVTKNIWYKSKLAKI